eukprot:3643813-Prymnesium_polylepis.1
MGCGALGEKTLLTRYGEGGINRAHQDQCTHPYQGYLLLSRPGRDFVGGSIYLTDPAAKHAAHTAATGSVTGRAAAAAAVAEVEVEWANAGELVVFAANATAADGRHWYHGVRE